MPLGSEGIVKTLNPNGQEIRKFSDSGIQDSINKAINTLEPGKSGAVVAYADLEKVNLAVVSRLGNNWSVVGILNKPYNGKLGAEAAIKFSW